MTDTNHPDSTRTAGFDANNVWHDPGNGRFARPGWSTAKGIALTMIRGFAARDLAKANRDRKVRLRPDGSALERLGIPDGSAVDVAYLDDDFGIIEIRTDRAVYPTKIRWDRFADPVPGDDIDGTAEPHFPNVPVDHNYQRNIDEIVGTDVAGPMWVDLTGVDFSDKSLEGVDLTGAVMQNVALPGRSVQHSKLWGVDLTRAELSGTVFDDTILGSATLDRANAVGSSFRGADLAGATLIRADLTGADLTGARLNGATFYGANLTGARFGQDVQVDGVDFREANLNGADLSGVTNLDRADMENVRFNSETRFPDGFDTSALIDTSDVPRMFNVTPVGEDRTVVDVQRGFSFDDIADTAAPAEVTEPVDVLDAADTAADPSHPDVEPPGAPEPAEPVEAPVVGLAPFKYRGRDYLVHPDGTVVTSDGKRVGAATASKIRAKLAEPAPPEVEKTTAARLNVGDRFIPARLIDYAEERDRYLAEAEAFDATGEPGRAEAKRNMAVTAQKQINAGFTHHVPTVVTKPTDPQYTIASIERRQDYHNLPVLTVETTTGEKFDLSTRQRVLRVLGDAPEPHVEPVNEPGVAEPSEPLSREAEFAVNAGRIPTGEIVRTEGRVPGGRMRRPAAVDAAPKPGDIRRIDGEPYIVTDVDVEFIRDIEAEDMGRYGVETGWYWSATGMKVEPTSDEIETAAAAERAKSMAKEIGDTVEAVRIAANTHEVSDLTRLDAAATITVPSAGRMTVHDGQVTLTTDGEVWWQHPGFYDDYRRTEGRVDDPAVVDRVKALIAASPKSTQSHRIDITEPADAQTEQSEPVVDAPWKSGRMTVRWDDRVWRIRPDGVVVDADNKRVPADSVIAEQVRRQAIADAVGGSSEPVDIDIPEPVETKIDNAVETEIETAIETDLEAPIPPAPDPQPDPEAVAEGAPAKNGKFPPTEQQLAVLEAFKSGESMVVQAGAGAGKSSTLVLLAEQALEDGRHGLFTAFNKAIVSDIKAKLPENVNAATMHAIANRAMRSSRPELMKRLNSKAMARTAEAKLLGITEPVRTEERTLRPAWLAGWVMKGVERFAMSADTEPGLQHFEPIRGVSPEDNDRIAAAHLGALRRAWTDLTSDDGKLRFGHSTYLKMFELSNPNLGTSFVLFDESQDSSPVMASIITQQMQHGTQLVFVGDADQSINGFMGAVDALSELEKVDGVKSTVLNKSFRFGPEVAEVANNVLAWFSGARIEGAGKPSTIGEVSVPDAVLTRTNGTAMARALGFIRSGKTVAMSENLVNGLRGFARAASDLQEKGWTDHSDLAPFASWGDVQRYVEDDAAGADIKTLVDLVDEHGPDKLLDVLDTIRPPGNGDVTVVTVHTSKGLEFPKVVLEGDFPNDVSKMTVDDFRLMYVAVTRAKERLDVGPNLWVLEPPPLPVPPRDVGVPALRTVKPTFEPEFDDPDMPVVPDVVPLIDAAPENEGEYAGFTRRFPAKLVDGDIERNPELRSFAKRALHEVLPTIEDPTEFLTDLAADYPADSDRELSIRQARGVLNSVRHKIAEDPSRFDAPDDWTPPPLSPVDETVVPGDVVDPDAGDPDAPEIPDVPAPAGRGAMWTPAQIRAALRRINSSMRSLDIVNGRPVVATTAESAGGGQARVTRTVGIVDSDGVFHPAGATETLTMTPRFGGPDSLAKWYAKQWAGDGVEHHELREPHTAAVDGGGTVVEDDDGGHYPGGAVLIGDRRPGMTTTTTGVHVAALVTEHDALPFNPKDSAGVAALTIDGEPVAVWLAGVTPTVGDVAEVAWHQGWRVVAQESGDGEYDNMFTIRPLPPVDRCKTAAAGSPAVARGQWLIAKDNYLSRIGVKAGEAVQVRYQDDENGIIDVDVDGEVRPYPVKWDRFIDATITDDTALITNPKRHANVTKAASGAGVLAERRVRAAGVGHAIVADGYLTRYGVAAGAVVPVTWVDETTAMVAAPSGQTIRAAWSRFTDTDPATVTLEAMTVVNGTEFETLPVGARFGVEALGSTVQTADGRVAALVKSSATGYTVAGDPVVEHEWNTTIAAHLRLLVEKD